MFMAELPGWELALGGGVAGLLIAASGVRSDRTWLRRLVDFPRVLSTIFHEAAHGLVCLLAGGRVGAIKINSPDTGFTLNLGLSWFSSVLAAFAGYAAPPLAGLGVAVLIDGGQARTALVLTVVVMVLVLTVSRGFLTVAYVGAIRFVVFAVVYWGSPELQLWVAYVEAWLLLLCEIVGLRQFSAADADVPRRKTLIPRTLWILAWLALNGWALWVAVPLLWP